LNLERLEDRSLLAASYDQIGINFIGGSNGVAGAAVTGMAGVIPQTNWNNVANNGTTSTGGAQVGEQTGLVTAKGVSTTATIEWSANNTWIVATPRPADTNAQLFKGYLDTTDTSTTSVAIDGVPFDYYDMYVYFDGDAALGRSGMYSVDDGDTVHTQGPHLDSANWPIAAGGGEFILADEPNEAGNYAIFRGLSGDSVTLTARATDPIAFRAPINAIQLVAYPTPLVVNALGDTDDGKPDNGTMTLREAVNLSNSIGGPAEITFDLRSGLQRLMLSGSELLLSDDVIIAGPGIESLMIDAAARSRVFRIAPGVHAELSGLWITNGNVLDPPVPPTSPRWGGGILNDSGSLTIERCWIHSNQAEYGAGIENWGHSGNLAKLIIRDSTISYNRGGGLGNSGVDGAASATLIGSTVAYNEAHFAAGVLNYQEPGQANGSATLDVTNSTISGNTARDDGGGIVNWYGVTTLTASTVAKNDADGDRNGIGKGGGIYNAASTVRIARSIVADNTGARNADFFNAGGAQTKSLGQNWFHRGVPGSFLEYVYLGAPGQYDYYSVVRVPTGVTWEQANIAAVAGGGHLATITSQEENDRIAGLVPYHSIYWADGGCCSFGPWIGGRQTTGATEPSGGWTWVTGEPFTFANWYAGEPNDYGGVEHHLALYSTPPGTASGQWNDMPGDSNTSVAYIVEYDALEYDNSDWVGFDPRLQPLADNGGPTWTHGRQYGHDDRLWPFLKTIEESNPLAWWPMDDLAGTAATEIVGNRHGAYSGSVRSGQLGVPTLRDANRGVELDGNGAQIVVPYESALNGPSFGLEVWAKLDSTTGGPYPIISNAHVDASGNTSGYVVEMYGDGRISVRSGTGTPDWWTRTTDLYNVRPGEWNYISVGFTADSGPDAKGAYYGTSSFTSNANTFQGGSAVGYKPNTVSPLRIGADWTGAAPFFDGRIDEVVLYDGERTTGSNWFSRPSEGTYGSLWQITPTGPATQSSTWFDQPQLAASRAIDGDTHTFSHTALGDTQSQWRLDLGESQPIGQIVLHNRLDCCASRLRDITVEILAPTGQVVFRSALLNPENVMGGGAVNIGPPALVVDVTELVGGPVTGKTIVVRRTPDPDLSGSDGQGFQGEDYLLQLGEVQVFLTAPDVDQRGISRPRGGGFDTGSVESTNTRVVGRRLFYNNSSYDGNNAAATSDDDNAIDTGRSPLLPGQTAKHENYSSFVHGINGIMIDVSDLGKTPTLAELDEYFAFRVGNSNDFGSWTAAPPPIAVSTRPGAGVNGSDRITLIWPDGAIRNQWLEVTVLPGLSGLTAPDVFYFGSAVGDNGDLTANRRVDFVDRNTVLFVFGPARTPGNPFDVNRDSVVDQTDADLVEQNYTALTGDLNFDDTVTLADLAIMQANLGSAVPTDPFKGDLSGDSRVDRTDVAILLFGDPPHRFGSHITQTMLNNRLLPISIPAASPTPPSPSASVLADAALATTAPAPSRANRLVASRAALKPLHAVRPTAVDRAIDEQTTQSPVRTLTTGSTTFRASRSPKIRGPVVERPRPV
jgi:hypothetical protein